MNIIWIVADSWRQDHLGAYGNSTIRTPSLDALAKKSVRFDRHHIAAFPTMPTRADHMTGRWTMSFMGWESFADDVPTLAATLAGNGFHTAAVADTPFYWRNGMNFDRGFQTFFTIQGQEGSPTRVQGFGHHESRDVRGWWRRESDLNAPQTMIRAGDWLERHYNEDFFLYVDTWDPHEPWEAPGYYTELYLPDYDGEIVQPPYARWQDAPELTAEKVEKAHATYCGEITMVDTWIGYLLRKVENMGLMENTAIIFTSDHGFYFGEHGGLFGKMTLGKRSDGSLYRHGDPDVSWVESPLYEEVTAIPLLIYVPGATAGAYEGLTSAIDVMPTVLDLTAVDRPTWVEGQSLLPAIQDPAAEGRDFTISSIPFANPGESIRSVDNISRVIGAPLITTVTTSDWTLLYTTTPGMSELYDTASDPAQEKNVISSRPEVAAEIHQLLVDFMKETQVPDYLLKPRLQLNL